MTPVEPSPRQPTRLDAPPAGTEDRARRPAASFDALLQAGAAQVRPPVSIPAGETFAAQGSARPGAEAVPATGLAEEVAPEAEAQLRAGLPGGPDAAVRALRVFLDVRFGAEAIAPAGTGAPSEQPTLGAAPALGQSEAVQPAERRAPLADAAAEPGAQAFQGLRFRSVAAPSAGAAAAPAEAQAPIAPARLRLAAAGAGMPASLAARGEAAGTTPKDAAPAAASRAAPDRGRQTGSPSVQVTIQNGTAGVDVVVRLGQAGSDERARLRDEIAALLAAHGVQIGTVDVIAPVFLSSQNEDA